MTPYRIIPQAYVLAALALAWPVVPKASAAGGDLPGFVQKDGRHAFIVDGAPFLILGGQCGNSSAWPAELPGVWSAIERIRANTLEIPVYWEQFEPEPGKFDPTIVDAIIRQARE